MKIKRDSDMVDTRECCARELRTEMSVSVYCLTEAPFKNASYAFMRQRLCPKLPTSRAHTTSTAGALCCYNRRFEPRLHRSFNVRHISTVTFDVCTYIYTINPEITIFVQNVFYLQESCISA